MGGSRQPSGDQRWAALIVLAAFVVYLVHASTFGRWIVDDAGISFSYARSLAGGHGFVSQPGAEPVEGYSNFLWVAVLAGFFVTGAFDPVWTPKLVAGALVLATFVVLTRLRFGQPEATPSQQGRSPFSRRTLGSSPGRCPGWRTPSTL